MFDVTVIGGGVVGGLILRELTKYNLKVCLLEAENDVSMGASRANSGIVHAGFDAKEGSLKAKFNVLGNKMMPSLCEELGVKYKNNGSMVVAFSSEEMKTLGELKERGIKNGVEGLEIIDRKTLVELEPNISDNALGALLARTGGIVCPYGLTIAAVGNAMDNGAELFTDFEVTKIDKGEFYTLYSKDGRIVESKMVINSAGINADKIANMVGDNSFTMGARKGEYILLDRESGNFCFHTLFFCPTKLGKGILVSPTVDGNLLLGPTAEEQEDKEDKTTSSEGLKFVQQKAAEMCKNIPFFNTITSFAGVRAYCDRHDFIIEESKGNKNFFNLGGIESPGLTSSPAIAKYVVEELVGKNVVLIKNENFNGKRKKEYFFKDLSDEEKNALIMENPDYGKIICRCEGITKGEIINAIRENPKATSVDGVKRRTRAGMGRCQGGFCQPQVVELLAKELGVDYLKVTKSGKNSVINMRKTK